MTQSRRPFENESPVSLVKLIGDILTGQVEDRAPEAVSPGKDQAAVALGRNKLDHKTRAQALK